MDIGKLRHRVWLQAKTESRNAEGGIIPSWTSNHEMWAAISPMSGRELEIAKQMQSEATIKVTIRWQSAFGFSDLPSMRFITSEDQILQIESALDADFMHHFITCYCILVTGQNPQAVLIDPNTTEPLLIGL